jgi:exodeoxyribonuclease VII large subunit
VEILQTAKDNNPLNAVMTVSQLTSHIKDVLENVFSNVYVVGEISNAKLYPSGHWYFSLKDKDATLPCVCFKSSGAHIKFKLEDGLQVVARGKISLFAPKGAYQMIASTLEPVGIGAWQLAFEQLKEALDKEGLLDIARKRPIPMLPRKVGIVTSTAGAALRDILSALYRRNKNVSVVISPTRVQGEGSAEEVAQAILDVQKVPGIDVIIVARGGGSIEDLWSFNTEVVARAVAGCSVPVVSGVGHETDTTICDLVADLRAPTPTAAAELVARGSKELFDKFKNLEQSLIHRLEQKLQKARRNLDKLNPYNALLRYQDRLRRYTLKVEHLKHTIERNVTHLLAKNEQRWRRNYEKLLALAPLQILNRGFAILRKKDGSIIRNASEVQSGDELEAILRTGSLKLTVHETNLEYMPLFQTDAPESKQSNEEKDFSQPHKPENITASKPHVPHSRPGSTEAIAPSTVSSSEKKAVNRRNHSRQNSGEKPSVAAHQLNLFGSTPALEAEKPETTESKNAEVSTIDEQDIQTPTTNEQNHNNEDES